MVANIYRQPGTSPERDKLILDVYRDLLQAYKGFYVGNFSGAYLTELFIGAYYNVPLPSKKARDCAVFALKKHNEDEGTKLKLSKMLRANISSGRSYFLTFKASDDCCYEAKVFCAGSNWKLILFRPACYYHIWSSRKKVDFRRVGISKSTAKSLAEAKSRSPPKWRFKSSLYMFRSNFRAPSTPDTHRVIFNDQSTDLEIITSATDKGFHKGATGTCSVSCSSYRVRDAARLALEEHNKNEGTDLKLKKIIRANVIGSVKPQSRCIYYITLMTTNKCFYGAKVFCKGRRRSDFRVLLFRSAEVKCKEVEVSFDDESLDMDATDDKETHTMKRCARLIVEEHNKNEGCDLELESEMS